MDTKTINVIGAAAVFITGAAASAPLDAEPIPAAASYSDLLQPVSDAVARIDADDAARDSAPSLLHEAQYSRGPDAHHHHHHHHHNRRWYYQHGYYWNGRMWMMRPVRHHHHHHHHHQMD